MDLRDRDIFRREDQRVGREGGPPFVRDNTRAATCISNHTTMETNINVSLVGNQLLSRCYSTLTASSGPRMLLRCMYCRSATATPQS